MVILQRIAETVGDVVDVKRVLRVEDRLYVEVWQTCDATEPTLMCAVNRAVDAFVRRCKARERYGAQERARDL